MYGKIFKALLPIIFIFVSVFGTGIFAYNMGKSNCEKTEKELTIQKYQKETEHKKTVEEEISSNDYTVIVDRLLSEYCRKPCN